jgi:hypothetical protein
MPPRTTSTHARTANVGVRVIRRPSHDSKTCETGRSVRRARWTGQGRRTER